MSETVDSSAAAIAAMLDRLIGWPCSLQGCDCEACVVGRDAAALLAQVARERDEAIDFGSRLMVEVLDHCGVAYRGDDEFERLELIEILAAHNREFDRETARSAAAERQLAEARALLQVICHGGWLDRCVAITKARALLSGETT